MRRKAGLVLLVFFFLQAGFLPAYPWPNKVNYQIEARLDTENNRVYGHEVIYFTNLTGKPLAHVWLHLFSNAYKNDLKSTYMKDLITRAGVKDPRIIYKNPEDDAYLQIEKIKVDGQAVSYSIEDTLMRVNLDPELAVSESCQIEIDYLYDLMEATRQSKMAAYWGVRSGHRNGVYTISKWFPKVAVYDKTGWNLDQYRLLGEFYADFGNYQVNITAPKEMVVGATGDLQNVSYNSDGSKTLYFKASRVHDFAWVASARYQRLEFSWNGIKLEALFLDSSFEKIGETTLDALIYYSQQFGKYAYHNLCVAQVEVGGGMEYPGIVMIGEGSEREVAHEVAHQWWYGAVGNDEVDQAWLDEGFTVYSTENFLIHRGDDPLSIRHSARFEEIGIPVLTPSNEFTSLDTYFDVIYRKGSGILWMLRYLLGKELMREVLKVYYHRFKYQNVHVGDFTSTAQEISGRQLDWFFRQWLQTTETLDFSVSNVSSKMADETGKILIHQFQVVREGEAVMPVQIEVILIDDGKEIKIEKKWDGKTRFRQISIHSKGILKSITADPQKIILEENRANNRWLAKK